MAQEVSPEKIFLTQEAKLLNTNILQPKHTPNMLPKGDDVPFLS